MLFWWISGEKSPTCGGVVADLESMVADLRCGDGFVWWWW